MKITNALVPKLQLGNFNRKFQLPDFIESF
jgi:hypothetical protein